MNPNDSEELSRSMSEVDSEHLPNNAEDLEGRDEEELHEDERGEEEADDVVTVALSDTDLHPDQQHVLVATSQGILTADQLGHCSGGVKTTHIVIHDQSLHQAGGVELSMQDHDGLRSPTTPLPPPTPSSPLSREKGFKYQWDESVFMNVLPVRCKNTSAELHKARFGSGGRGRCIHFKNAWYTPSEYEALCGRASSKDWKRSIRFGGRTLQCLIEDGIIQPHATSCTCAACCDDTSVTGPVRLFQPYKRRKRDGNEGVMRKKSLSMTSKSPLHESPSKSNEAIVYTLGSSVVQPFKVEGDITDPTTTIQIIPADASGHFTQEQLMSAVKPNLLQTKKGMKMESDDHKKWWQLTEMVSNLTQQVLQLKEMVEQTKEQAMLSKEDALRIQRQHLEKEKNDAIAALRIETQLNLSRAIFEERSQKDIAIQQALAQARAGLQHSEKVDSVTVVSDDKQVFTVTFAPPTQDNMDNIMEADGEDSDKEK